MCGRYALSTEFDKLPPLLRDTLPAALAAHYAPMTEVRPGQPVLGLRQEHGQIGAALLLWGCCRNGPRSTGRGQAHQCRSETVATRASFRGPWRHRRCLLAEAMAVAGFSQHPHEWWHYSYGDQLWAWRSRQPTACYGRWLAAG